jgi:hypothetical protein
VTVPPDRRDALAVLRLPPSADAAAVKRAYRKLARAHHPDLGGDTARFHELQQAYELLIAAGPAPRRPARRGRPSRHHAAWSSGHDGRPRTVDLGSVRWNSAVPIGEVALDRDGLAVRLAAPHDAPVHPATATSRAPGSRLNAVAAKLSPDLTSSLAIELATDDRRRLVVATAVTSGNRRARRALDTVGLDGGWVRTRGSTSTTLRAADPPDDDRRMTALRTVDRLEDLLERLGWPLTSWTVTASGH